MSASRGQEGGIALGGPDSGHVADEPDDETRDPEPQSESKGRRKRAVDDRDRPGRAAHQNWFGECAVNGRDKTCDRFIHQITTPPPKEKNDRKKLEAANLIGLVISGSADVLPDLLLPDVVGRNREGHELLEGHAVFGINIVQLWRNGRQPQSLLHGGRRHKMPGRDIFLGHADGTQGLEGSELIERMKPYPLVILCERVFAMRFCFTRSSSAR